MATISPQSVFNYLIQEHGVSPQYAAGILANIEAESLFNPTAVGDNGTSGGLLDRKSVV